MPNEQLWAPWRMAYIVGEKEKEPAEGPAPKLLTGGEAACFLCRAAATTDDRRRLVVARGKQTVVVLNRYPYNNGHLLVAPQRHCGRLEELGEEVERELARTITHMVASLQELMNPQGFNIGLNLGHAAGAGLPGHLHWHIVPRWTGDTNFMPTIASVNTIPQALDALWQLLVEHLEIGRRAAGR